MATNKNKKQNNEKSIPAKKTAKKPAGINFPVDFYWVGVGLVLLFVLLVRSRLLGIPFERDEGEYAYMGKLILHGGMPYRDAYNMKLPGTYLMYSIIIAVFGSTPWGIHAGLMLFSIATIVLLFISLRKLFNPSVALVTVAIYGMLSVTRPFLGFAAHATHFVNFFLALALFFYVRYFTDRKFKWAGLAGLMIGISFLMKQQAVFFILFFGIVIIIAEVLNRPVEWKKLMINLIIYSIGVFIPYTLVLIVMSLTGSFDKFWFWTVTYATAYASGVKDFTTASALFHFSFDRMYADYPLIWILAPIGLILPWFGKTYTLFQKIFASLFVLLSAASVCPGFYFREHYFIVFIPALGLLIALTLDYIVSLINKEGRTPALNIIPFAAVTILTLVTVSKNKFYYSEGSMENISRWAYGANPFIEIPEIAKYLKSISNDTDKIGVLGSEPEMFIYADRKSATKYMYVYPLLETHPYNKMMQKEMIAELEKSKPKFMVYINVSTSWLVHPGAPTDILTWINKYLPANYDLIGLADIPPDGSPTSYYWGDQAQRKPEYQNYVHVLKRKGS